MSQIVYQRLAARIKEIREVTGMTQDELATRCAVSRGTIANIETGRQEVTLLQFETLAGAFGITPKALLKRIWL